MDAIAAAAGVAPRTVYTSFGAKREILSAICERWLEEAHARQILGMAMAEADPARTLRLGAFFLRSLFEHGYDVCVLFDAASDDDAATREMLRGKLNGRNQAQDAVIATIGESLVIPLPAAQAVFRALASTGIYRELVVESGWLIDHFEDWIAESLTRQLLGRPALVRDPAWPAVESAR
jgi:AcrR family transcriptional regulator